MVISSSVSSFVVVIFSFLEERRAELLAGAGVLVAFLLAGSYDFGWKGEMESPSTDGDVDDLRSPLSLKRKYS
jgi:hypothetical protein